MRRICLGLLAGLALFPTAPRAEDTPARACDLAAASPYDATRPTAIPGVVFEKVEGKVAVPACEGALAAEPDNVRLIYQMGRALQANKEDDRARTFYEKAAGLGHPGAQHNLAHFYQTGRGGLPRSEEEAVRLYKLAADQGLAIAQYVLGYFYASGQHWLPQDDREAVRLYKLAADQNYALAQYELALFYTTGGGGLEKNDQEAAQLLKLAADQGLAPAQNKLATFYAAGRGGLEKNDDEPCDC
jgi:TPR repeat protein